MLLVSRAARRKGLYRGARKNATCVRRRKPDELEEGSSAVPVVVPFRRVSDGSACEMSAAVSDKTQEGGVRGRLISIT